MASRDADEVLAAIVEREELTLAKALESDYDTAFRLQMQEAITASLALQPTSSSTSTSTSPSEIPVVDDDNSVMSFLTLQAEELVRFEQEKEDRECVEAVLLSNAKDLKRRLHDQKLAIEISKIPDPEWLNTGDNFERPFVDGASSSADSGKECFLLYSKGLVSEEEIGNDGVLIAGIGVAICDPRGNLIFEVQKPLKVGELGQDVAELEALIQSLNTALILKLERVTVHCDNNLTYLYITGRWQTLEGKISELVQQVVQLKEHFIHCNHSLVSRDHLKHAYKLARDAIASQNSQKAESSYSGKSIIESCAICLEDIDVRQMIFINPCQHRYCVTCLRQHVVVMLHQAKAPGCPHGGCFSRLSVDGCTKFLTPELLELMTLRIKEASIPASEKVYCPHPKCSALMSLNEVYEYSLNSRIMRSDNSGKRKCLKCGGLFCVLCKVPWHASMTCDVYKRVHPYPCAEDAKLKSLATSKKWRQCVKCNHMVELATGCNHIYCRCGFQFCYICGAEWRNKKATCSCPLWDERHIVYSENRLR